MLSNKKVRFASKLHENGQTIPHGSSRKIFKESNYKKKGTNLLGVPESSKKRPSITSQSSIHTRKYLPSRNKIQTQRSMRSLEKETKYNKLLSIRESALK